jgi:gliding motility-associated-like protein
MSICILNILFVVYIKLITDMQRCLLKTRQINTEVKLLKMNSYSQQATNSMKRLFMTSVVTCFILLQTAMNVHAHNLKPIKEEDLDISVKESLNRFDKEIYFTQNQGQWPENVLYKADFKYGQAIATREGMIVGSFDPASIDEIRHRGDEEEEAIHKGIVLDASSRKKQSEGVKSHGWMMNFQNASPKMQLITSDKHIEKFGYYLGNKSNEHISENNNYQEIWYKNVYDKVDVRYYPAETGTLEYDIICKPGFDNSKIAIKFEGIDKLNLNSKGELSFNTSVGEMHIPAPYVYQTINGIKQEIVATYVVSNNNVLSFDLGAYDANLPLIIDPIALRWATWITNNSDGEDHGHGIWVDQTDGAIYILARIINSGLITVGPYQAASAGSLDIVLGKYLEPTTVGGSGTRVWQTYLGGSGDDNPYALEQGPDGNIYLTGYTSSTNFPLLGGGVFSGTSLDARSQTSNNIFITKINKAGTSIKSAVIGGNGDEQSFDLRFDPSGNIIIGGYTNSTNLATQYAGSGASNTNNGGTDALIFKINSNLNSLLWMKNYGGASGDRINILNVKQSTGDIYIAGTTSSNNFPLISARQSSRGGSEAGFLQKLNSSGTIQWSSYFSSESGSKAAILCMELDKTQDTLYFGGLTSGLNASNITAGAYDMSYNSNGDFFVSKMAINQTYIAGTYLGGSALEDNMMGLNVDENNDVYIFGYTRSTNFPITTDALQTSNLGGQSRGSDKSFTKLKSNLASVLYSTYYGGTRDDYDPVGERGIKFSNCRIYTIITSTSNDIPLTQGAITTTRPKVDTYEPGLVVWANPPDFINNSITPNQTICPGVTPANITGTEPSYLLPTIVRNGTTSSYPALSGSNTYQWQKSTDSITWVNIAGATNKNLSGALLGPVTEKIYIRRIIGGDACVIEQGLVLFVNTLSVIGTKTNTNCQGSKNGSIDITPKNGTPSYTYLWNDGATSQDRTNLGEGIYSVTVTDAGGCSVVKTFTIDYTKPKPNATANAAPSTICQGNSTSLSYTSDIAVSVVGWFDNCAALGTSLGTNATIVVNPTNTMIYSVVVETPSGCRDTACVTVTVNTKPEITATISNNSICRTQSSELSFTPKTGITSTNWYLDDASAGCKPVGASLSSNQNYIVSPTTTTSYAVVVQTAAGCKDTSCITLTINDCYPEAIRDLSSTNEDTPITIPVLNNDTFGGNGPNSSTIIITSNPSNGTAVVNNGGTPTDPTDDQIIYTPNPNFNGNDVLIYQICDSDNDCDTAIVYITVKPVDDQPIANRDLASTNEDTPLNSTVVPNDVMSGDGGNTFNNACAVCTSTSNGTLVFNPDGTYTYTPNANYNGNDQFIYQLCDIDNDCDTAIVYITVKPVDDQPIANRDLASTNEDTPLNSTVVPNDVMSGDGGNTFNNACAVCTSTSNGTLVFNPDGTYTYTPNANYNGNDQFIYQLCDIDNDCDTAIVYITVKPVDDQPIANRDLASTNEDTPLNSTVVPNDVMSGDGGNTFNNACAVCTNTSNGTLVFNPDGTYTYTPNANYNGNDQFIYQLCDIDNDCDTAIVYITVKPVDDQPIANRDLASTNEDTPLNSTVVPNDVMSGDGGNTFNNACAVCTNTSNGTLVFNPDGTYTYTPNANYNGNDQFIYQLCDIDNDCDTAIVYITVKPVDDQPIANRDLASTNEDTPLNSTVVPNDVMSGDGGNTFNNACAVCTNTSNGTLVFNPDGTYTYTPNANYNGNDQFIYQLCDIDNDCDTAIVYITVNPVDDQPIANRDLASTNEDTPLNSTVVPNDVMSGDGGNTFNNACAVCTNTSNGTLVFNPDGTYTYTPNANYNGNDQFIYQLCDIDNDCDTAIVYITVKPVDDQPIANRDLASTNEDTPLNSTVVPNDVMSGDGGNTFNNACAVCTNTSNGTLVFNPDGTYTYTPNANYNGNDQFIYQLCDIDNDCDTAIVYIIIGDDNDSPLAVDDRDTTCEDIPTSGNVALNDIDLDGPSVYITKVSGPNYGVIYLNTDGSYTYTPNINYNGRDTVVYSYCDLGNPNLCDTASLFIVVTPVNDSIAKNMTVHCDGQGNTQQLQAWLASNGGATPGDECYNCTWTNNFTGLSDGCGKTGSANVTFTLTYDCGIRNTNATFTIIDTLPPSITPAEDATVECDGQGNTQQLQAWLMSHGGASASDICSGVNWSNDYAGLSDGCGNTGSAYVTFTATDSCGNSTSTSATFTIRDTTAPSIDVKAEDATVECDGQGNTQQLQAWLMSHGGASASDICSGVNWSNDYAGLSDGCGNTGSAYVTFTATDSCGNSTSTSATFTIRDTTAPSIDVKAEDATVECDGQGNTQQLQAWLTSHGGASASDICSGVNWSNDYAGLSDGCGNTGSAYVTFTATDSCGNSTSTSATFTIRDTTAPSIDVKAEDATVECDGQGNTQQLQAWLMSHGGASASDICSGVNWSNDYAGLSDGCGNTGSAYVTFTATDSCGNSTSTSATFTIRDTTAPSIDVKAEDATVECDGQGNTQQLQAWLMSHGGASASDICSGVNWSNDYAGLSDGCGNTGSAYVTFTATDSCGNSTSTSATFTIRDTTAPSIDVKAEDATVECDGQGNTQQLQAWLTSHGGASASDICSGVNWSNDYAGLSDGCGNTGSAYVTFTATDSCGNSTSTSATFTIRDTTAPSIDVKAEDAIVECDGQGNTQQLQAWLTSHGGASASDICSGVNWSNDYAGLSDGCGNTGSAYVTFTATDSCGNSTSTSATFTIRDTTAPSIDVKAEDATVECDGQGNTQQLQAWLTSHGGASASDICSGVNWSNDYAGLSDGCGNTGSAYVTFTATDSCGNSTSTSATFTIRDTTAPSIDVKAEDATVECDGQGNTQQLQAWLTSHGGASASDICSGVNWSNDYAGLSDGCGNTGSAYVTFTATDSCGNSTSTSATFTIRDTTAPSIDVKAEDATVECDGQGNTQQLQAWLMSHGGASASDICSGVNWSNDYAGLSDGCGNTGSAYVTFTATDSCGNSTSTSATFTIRDTTAPSIDVKAEDATVECDGQGNTQQLQAWLMSHGGASASDICSGVNWSNDYAGLSDGCGNTGSAYVTFTATDSCGNSTSTSATFTIRDTTAPSIDVKAEDATVECDGQGNTQQLQAWLTSHGGASASDICSGVNWSNDYAGLSDGCGNTGSAYVTFTATDSCGNSTSTSATFTIRDTTAPTFIGTLPTDENTCDQVTPPAVLTAVDNCGSAHVIYSERIDSVSQLNTTIYTRTWIAIDECNNTKKHTQTIKVSDIIRVTIAETICEGERYVLGTNSYGLSGTYTSIFTSESGCDSIVTLNLTVNAVKHTNIDAVLCQGEQVIIGGTVYTESVTNEIIHLETSTGCDSIITLNLVVLKQDTIVTERTICAGDYVEIGGQRFTSAGTYYLPIQNNQCNGVIALTVKVNMPTQSTINRVVCDGESTTVAGHVYSETGTYEISTQNSSGCDSLIILHLTVLPKSINIIDSSICIGNSVVLGGNSYYGTGTYTIKLQNIQGCDSIITLHLTVLEEGDTTYMTQSICSGESITIGDETFTKPGTYYISTSSANCDGVIELSLSVNEPSRTTVEKTLCDGEAIVVGGQTFTSSGTYTVTLQNSVGCDSIITLNLNITTGGSKVQVDTTICNGESVTYANQTFFQTGMYQIVYPTDACRDTLLLNLIVNPEIKVTIAETICEGERYVLGTNSYGLSGTYTSIFTSESGCDSIVTLNLTVNAVKHTNIDAVLCQGEQVIIGGTVYTESVTNEIIHLETSTGCDSIITLNLVVLKQDTIVTERTICAGDYVEIGGQRFTSAGTYYLPIQNNQCNGVIALTVKVNMPSESSMTTSICEGEVITVGGYVFNTTGLYHITSQNILGCDSVITLNLSVIPKSKSTIYESICAGESVIVDGHTFNATGTYTIKLQNVQGCDSLITLHLTVLEEGDTTYMTQSICSGESITIGGETFTKPGTYYISTSSANCDGVIELSLSVNEPSRTTVEKTLCDGEAIVVGGQTFTSSGTYTVTLQNSVGCDSIITLNLNITTGGSKVQVDSTVCFGEAVAFAGQTFSQSGTYQIVYPVEVCRDTILLNLTVNPITDTIINTRICIDSSITIGGQVFSEAGNYEIIIPNALGCDSIINLHLRTFLCDTVPLVDVIVFDTLPIKTSLIECEIIRPTADSVEIKLCDGSTTGSSSLGSWTFNVDSCLVYTAGPLKGNDTICVTACNKLTQQCVTTTIIVTITGYPPTAVNDSTSTPPNEPVTIPILSNDTTHDEDPITLCQDAIITQPVHGTVVVNQDGTLTYTPSGTYNGLDSLQYQICDPEGNDTAWVYILVEDCIFPNAFSPNNDGINDYFVIPCLEGEAVFNVYNRWGIEVYRNDTYMNNWDGLYKGNPLPEGTYYYILQYTKSSGEEVNRAGFISLRR